MEIKDELTKIYIENCTCYHFDYIIIIKVTDVYFINNLLGKNYMKTF